MSKEIIELLESIKVVPAEDDSMGNTCCKMKVSDYCKINQALTLFKQQPTAGEYTEKLRNFVKMYENEIPRRAEITFLIEAEAELKAKDEIIFAYESVNAPINPLLAINKDLLEACIESQKVFGFIAENYKSAPHFPNAERLVDAVIAKAHPGIITKYD